MLAQGLGNAWAWLLKCLTNEKSAQSICTRFILHPPLRSWTSMHLGHGCPNPRPSFPRFQVPALLNQDVRPNHSLSAALPAEAHLRKSVVKRICSEHFLFPTCVFYLDHKCDTKGPFCSENTTTIAKIRNYYAVVRNYYAPHIYYAADPSLL